MVEQRNRLEQVRHWDNDNSDVVGRRFTACGIPIRRGELHPLMTRMYEAVECTDCLAVGVENELRDGELRRVVGEAVSKMVDATERQGLFSQLLEKREIGEDDGNG